MQGFVALSVPVRVHSRRNVISQYTNTPLSPSRRRDGSNERSGFLGKELKPVSCFVLSQHHLSVKRLYADNTVFCARIPHEDGETDKKQQQSENRGSRWWGLGAAGREDKSKQLYGEDLNTEDDRTANSEVEKSLRTDSAVENSKTVNQQGPDSEKNEKDKGFVGIMAKLIEPKRADETKKSSASESSNSEDAWTQFLNVIVPNRKRNQDKSDLTTSEPFSNMQETKKKPDTKSSPLDKLRSIRELYQPPMKSETKDESKDSDGLLETEKSKGNLIPKWVPWFGQSSKDEPTAHSQSERLIDKKSQSRENSVEGSSSEEDMPRQVAVLQKPRLGEDSTTVNKNVGDNQDVARAEAGAKTENTAKRRNGTNGLDRKNSKQPVGAGLASSPAVEVSSVPQKDVAAIRLIFGSETFFATETLSHPGGLIFRGNLRGEPQATLAKLEQRLAARLGDKYTLCLAEGEDDLRPVVVVVPTARDLRPASSRQKMVAAGLAVLTLFTCLTRGVYTNRHSGMIRSAYGLPPNMSVLEQMFLNAPITCTGVAIALIVLISQLVQRIMAARRKTRVAIPYLIPSIQLGSFGGLVQIASPTPSRAALFDIAFSGALTLVVVSVVLLIIGLQLSTSFASVIPVPMSMVSSSMLIGALTKSIPQGDILVDYGRSLIGLHPLAVIGANCLTIAALNLLPIRQLDGGRIVSAIYGRKTALLASKITIFFLLLASANEHYYVVFLGAVLFGPWNLDRPAKNELTEPNGVRAVLGYILLLCMVSILLPYPAAKFFGTA